MLGVLYMLGMALTYSVVGVVTSLSGAVFGTLMQNPYVITGIVILFIVLALSQFGVYEFQLPHSLVEKAGGAKGGMYGAFFMGLTMGIVAAPCIGPFVLGLVTYVAVKGDPWYGFVMFFTLALGLGFPYLILAIFSGKIKSLPRSGVWMEGVKHVFGLILLGMAFYFLDPVLPKAVRGYPLPVFGIIAAVTLLFFDKTANNVKAFRIFKTGFAVLVLAVSIYALIPKEKLTPAWKKFDNLSFEQALQNGDKVFIDFYADWCIPCKELDQLTFSDKRVIRALEGFTCFKVDMTQATEAGENLRKQFKVVGMPTLIIFDSKGVEQKRETGFLNADAMLERLATVK
jgi:thiol:disulfide interchange protein DsbD